MVILLFVCFVISRVTDGAAGIDNECKLVNQDGKNGLLEDSLLHSGNGSNEWKWFDKSWFIRWQSESEQQTMQYMTSHQQTSQVEKYRYYELKLTRQSHLPGPDLGC